LAIASFVVLFQELTLIRWMSGEVRVLAYFPNLVLISAFLGLGLGMLRTGRPSLLWTWPVSIAVTTVATLAMARVAFANSSPSEHLWLFYHDIPNAPVVQDVRPPIIAAFILSAICFVGLGQFVGERFREHAAAGRTLWGYVVDLAGSLVGVIAFAFASLAGTFPAVWFSVFLSVGAVLIARRGWRLLAVHGVIVVAVITSLIIFERAEHYSPYYALQTRMVSGSNGVNVLANGSHHQYAAPLSRRNVLENDFDRNVAAGYPIPYRVIGTSPRRVLILGAGTGNDIVTALENGALEVDAVEIDPVISEIGRTRHPDHPYDSPRVRLYNSDARAFLHNTRKKYDMIIFGTLDSMTRLSALSNVRLDNFVYTVEGMRAARNRLEPGGGVALYFMVANAGIHQKLAAMLNAAFDEPPLVRMEYHELFNAIYLAGPAFRDTHASGFERTASVPIEQAWRSVIPTDDWPFLYLDGRRPSALYLSMIGVLLVLSIGALLIVAPELTRRRFRSIDAEMFLYGAGFLLLETKLITQMSLVWGATWATSAVVFGSILAAMLVSTVAVQLGTLRFMPAAAGLAVSLIATYAMPSEWLLAESVGWRLVLSMVFAGGPIVFASMCFILRFRKCMAPHEALGWNVIGAVAGGLIEATSMAVGIRAMALIALVLYLSAVLLSRNGGTATREPEGGENGGRTRSGKKRSGG
jgi:SAM-dependent methyltransferase